jgi:aminomethyltransferase
VDPRACGPVRRLAHGPGPAARRQPAKSFEKLVSADYQGLKPGKQRYAVLLNAEGGVIDDLMTARPDDDGLFIVVNGACKDNDYAIIAEALKGEATVERLEDRALLALQGPEAAAVLAAHVPQAAAWCSWTPPP